MLSGSLLILKICLIFQLLYDATPIDLNINEEKKVEKFLPLIAFKCGYRNKFLSENGEWITDKNKYATCLSGKLDILKYCRKVYPKLDIYNIVEYKHNVKISSWCHEEGFPCKWTFTVQPYRCIVGEFQSEALQVPQNCRFLHDSHSRKCEGPDYWKNVADKKCTSKILVNKQSALHSYSLLEPCGLDMFTGVEFVCCPADKYIVDDGSKVNIDKKQNHNDQTSIDSKLIDSKITKSDKVDIDEDEDDEEEDDEDEYDDDYSDDHDDGTMAADNTRDNYQDPYYKISDPANEHEHFKDAQQRLEKRHRAKINKVMRELAELENRYENMKKKDPKGAEVFKKEMSLRFQKTVASLEEENKEQKKQLEDVHEERVQAHLNEKKRQATHDYRTALAVQVGKNNKHKILKTLKIYIRSEEKDRMHMINRYRHLLRTDRDEADVYEKILAHQLRYIDLRINGTLAMLRDFPELEKQIRPIALEFWSEYRRENTPEITDEKFILIGGDEQNAKLIKFYKDSYDRLHNYKPSTKRTIASPTTNISPTPKKLFIDDDDSADKSESAEIYSKQQPKVVIEKIRQRNPLKKIQDPIINVQNIGEEDDDADDDDDSADESEDNIAGIIDNKNSNKKELRIEVDSVPNHLLELSSAHQSYAKHSPLVHDKVDVVHYYTSNFGNITHLIIILAATTSIIFVLIGYIMMRKRSIHQGFIEVDVCTPEEKHLNCMQVNGYENPTYSFFDNKQ